MTTSTNLASLVAWWGFGLAFVFGYIANKTSFCTMGAVSDIVNMGSWSRMRMWMLAITVAMLGAGMLQFAGLVDLSQSIYARPTLNWLSHSVGGFFFGVGMTLGSGCGSKTLIRVGGGNLKSVVVMVFLGISAYMTMRGFFAPLRVNVLDAAHINLAARNISHQDVPTLIASATGAHRHTLALVVAGIFSMGMLIFIFKDREFRQDKNFLLGGLAVGLLVVAGWYVSGHVGYGENPETLEMVFFGTNSRSAESLTFVAPVAYTLELLLLWTDKSLGVTFGVATLIGTIAGSLAYALTSKTFRWESFASSADLRNHILGGMLMGFGGVCALGCTIGQGITGLSTLALGSFITLAAIIAGAAATMKFQYWRISRET